jgi:phage baseplate assembly protein W
VSTPSPDSTTYPDMPHMAFPFQMTRDADGNVLYLNVVEQDTDEHIMACEQVIAWCPLGARAERPEFGWPWPLFSTQPVDPSPLEQALTTYEPRGPVLSAVALVDLIGSTADITVQIGVP